MDVSNILLHFLPSKGLKIDSFQGSLTAFVTGLCGLNVSLICEVIA